MLSNQTYIKTFASRATSRVTSVDSGKPGQHFPTKSPPTPSYKNHPLQNKLIPFRSEDHRGTPESPGRVVTLIERSFWETLGEEPSTTPERVYGAAYRIPPSHVKEVQEYLDIREINGYSIQYTTFFPSPSSPASTSHVRPIERCLVYIGLPSNPQFLGRQSSWDVAEVIARSTGPSGANAEYLFMLEDALMELGEGSKDEHVRDLAERVRSLMKGGNGEGVCIGDGRDEDSDVKMQAVESEFERVRSGEGGQADEETEKVL